MEPLARDIIFFKMDDIAYCIKIVAEHYNSEIQKRREYAKDVYESLVNDLSKLASHKKTSNFFGPTDSKTDCKINFSSYLSKIERLLEEGKCTDSVIIEMEKSIYNFKRNMYG